MDTIDPSQLGGAAAWAFGFAAVIRVIMTLAGFPPVRALLERLTPAFLAPAVPLIKLAAPIVLACLLAALEALARGRPFGEAVLIGLGAWAGSEVTHRGQKQAKKVKELRAIRKGGSLSLAEDGETKVWAPPPRRP